MSLNKPLFRARALDSNKLLPIYQKDEISGNKDFLGQNRSVPQMPTGMEKEEESEHHLQKAISNQKRYGDKRDTVIPTPEAQSSDLNTLNKEQYNGLYKDTHRLPKPFLRASNLNLLDTDNPDYDLDDDDEKFYLKLTSELKMSITEVQLENHLDQLENHCSSANITFEEVQSLLKQEDSTIFKLIYNYWKNKREISSGTIIHKIRGERRDGANNNDSYVAFRRRTEKMQTRKNRKNDEAGYEKMLRIRREFSDAKKLMNMISTRENIKINLEVQDIKVYEKQRKSNDYDNKQYKECCKEITHHRQKLEKLRKKERKKRNAEGLLLVNKKKITTDLISRGQLSDPSTSKKVKKKRGNPGTLPQPFNQINRVNDVKKRNQQDLTRPASVVVPKCIQKTTPTNAATVVTSNAANAAMFKNSAIAATACKNTIASTPTAFQNVDISKPSNVTYTTNITSAKSSIQNQPKVVEKFKFKRNKNTIYYHEPLPLETDEEPNPWAEMLEQGYALTTIRKPDRCLGFTRRRLGRGGRIIIDRAYHRLNPQLKKLDLDPTFDHLPPTDELTNLYNSVKSEKWPHYHHVVDEINSADDSSETEEESPNSEQVVPVTKSVQQYIHPSTNIVRLPASNQIIMGPIQQGSNQLKIIRNSLPNSNKLFHVKTEPSTSNHFNLIAQQQKSHHFKSMIGEKSAILPTKQQVVMTSSMTCGKKYPAGNVLQQANLKFNQQQQQQQQRVQTLQLNSNRRLNGGQMYRFNNNRIPQSTIASLSQGNLQQQRNTVSGGVNAFSVAPYKGIGVSNKNNPHVIKVSGMANNFPAPKIYQAADNRRYTHQVKTQENRTQLRKLFEAPIVRQTQNAPKKGVSIVQGNKSNMMPSMIAMIPSQGNSNDQIMSVPLTNRHQINQITPAGAPLLAQKLRQPSNTSEVTTSNIPSSNHHVFTPALQNPTGKLQVVSGSITSTTDFVMTSPNVNQQLLSNQKSQSTSVSEKPSQVNNSNSKNTRPMEVT